MKFYINKDYFNDIDCLIKYLQVYVYLYVNLNILYICYYK